MSDEKTKNYKKSIPTHEEIEKMVQDAFPTTQSRCETLCGEFQEAQDAVDNASTPQGKGRALVVLHAISAQIKILHCQCHPQ
jgi:hypothetical protein